MHINWKFFGGFTDQGKYLTMLPRDNFYSLTNQINMWTGDLFYKLLYKITLKYMINIIARLFNISLNLYTDHSRDSYFKRYKFLSNIDITKSYKQYYTAYFSVEYSNQ